MSVVPLISLVDVASNEKHSLNSSQSVIGRGWLNCNDKRISRYHGVLKVISPNSVTVISTHQNSMFFRKKNNIEVNQIEQNREVNLYVGDSFGLLLDEFWFSIQPSDNDNDVIGDLHGTQSNADNSNAPTTSGIKRRSSSDSEPDSTNKRVKTEPKEFQEDATNEVDNEANGLSNGDLDTTLPTDNTVEMPSTSASASSANISQNENDTAIANRSIKPEPLDSDEVQSMPVVKTEPMSQESNVDSTMTPTPITVKTEVKSEPTDNENVDGATTSSGEIHQSPQRECCRYGVRCYRRNPAHRAEQAHPGDEDYRLPDYPDPPLGAAPCPYLDRCYRRNPAHFQQFSHKATWRTDSSGKEGYEATAKTPKAPKPTTNTATNTATNDDPDSEDDPYATDGDSDPDFQGDDSSDD